MRKPKMQGRRELAASVPVPDKSPDDDTQSVSGDVLSPLSEDIPPHVWAMLQEAGELAAQRLVEILASPMFRTIAPSAQRGLIELALTRAYGLPVRKALSVSLTSTDADAVAASLADLTGALPETARHSLADAMQRASDADPAH